MVHRDLKPENVLVTKDHKVILIDFGTAKANISTATGFKTKIGTLAYQAHEIIDRQEGVPMNYKVDIWSLGGILHFMCNKEHAFYAKTEELIKDLIK